MKHSPAPLHAPPRTRRLLYVAASSLAFATLAFAPPVLADPQASIGLTIGGAITDLRTDPVHGAFHLGGRGDVLFLRSNGRSMALGPYVDIATAAFDSLELGGGLEWLVPTADELPFVFSAGAFGRHTSDFGWEPGLSSTIFFGSRSYNFHSWYGLAAGLFVQGRYGLGDSKQADVILGAQIDLTLFAYPFLLLYGALR